MPFAALITAAREANPDYFRPLPRPPSRKHPPVSSEPEDDLVDAQAAAAVAALEADASRAGELAEIDAAICRTVGNQAFLDEVLLRGGTALRQLRQATWRELRTP